jgi:hypothetical protein
MAGLPPELDALVNRTLNPRRTKWEWAVQWTAILLALFVWRFPAGPGGSVSDSVVAALGIPPQGWTHLVGATLVSAIFGAFAGVVGVLGVRRIRGADGRPPSGPGPGPAAPPGGRMRS